MHKKFIKEKVDGATEFSNLKIKVTYDPMFNVFLFQVQDSEELGLNKDFKMDYANQPKPEIEKKPIYGAGVKRVKFTGNPNDELFGYLRRLNVKSSENMDKAFVYPVEEPISTKDLVNAVKLSKELEDNIDTNESLVQHFLPNRDETIRKIANDIIGGKEGVVFVTGFDWSNANMPSLTESLLEEFVNSDKTFDEVVSEHRKMIK